MVNINIRRNLWIKKYTKNIVDKYYKIIYNKCTYNNEEEIKWNLVLL